MRDQNADTATVISGIKLRSVQFLCSTVQAVEVVGGKAAARDFLAHLVDSTAGLAIAAIGKEDACAVMTAGLITAENYSTSSTETPEC